MVKPPHRLDLYRLAVQHPLAEVAFFLRVHGGRGRRAPTRLREDFCGTAAVATAWAAMHENHRAIGLDLDRRCLRWAQRYAQRELGPRSDDVILLDRDVTGPGELPRVDVIAATNFGVCELHTPDQLFDYFRGVRRGLRPGGVSVVDLFGGPGAVRPGLQQRRVRPDAHEPVGPFVYTWEQRRYDAVSGGIDCRIHFSGGRGRARWEVRNAFVYRWRLWTPPEVVHAMRSAGLREPTLWGRRVGGVTADGRRRSAARIGARSPLADGRFVPLRSLPNVEQWVACIVGRR